MGQLRLKRFAPFVLLVVAGALIVTGVALLNYPAAFIVAGVLLLVTSLNLEVRK